jgi:hypothetical protein
MNMKGGNYGITRHYGKLVTRVRKPTPIPKTGPLNRAQRRAAAAKARRLEGLATKPIS